MTKADSIIIKSSTEVPRVTALKRFPLPRNFGVSKDSQIEHGRYWPAPAGATRVKTFEVYRYNPDSGENPRMDMYCVLRFGSGRNPGDSTCCFWFVGPGSPPCNFSTIRKKGTK